MFEKLPTALKTLIVAGVLLIGPVMVLSLLFGGTRAGMWAILIIMVYFMVLYIVGVRRYSGEDEP